MRAIAAVLTILGAFGLPAAFAHGALSFGATPSWTFDPWIVIPLAASAALYICGRVALSSRNRAGGNARSWSVVAYAVGWLTLAGALMSPLHWLGEHVFTFHMIEHEIVMAISAPLLVLSRPVGPLLWGLPRGPRLAVARLMQRRPVRAGWAWLTRPTCATLIHGVVIWVWHAPTLFDLAVANDSVHRWQHLSFFIAAVLFWWSMLKRSNRSVAGWHLFITMLHTSLLGALMTLAPRVLYGVQTAHSADWGLTPLQDQQLAGLVMWIPAGTVYAGAALAMIALLIRQSGAEGGCNAPQVP
jgi:cytochrome c oxidase assembly factor CtaG